MTMKNILVTGLAGYIGSVCAYRLLKKGYNVTGIDNLSTGHIETIEKLKRYGNLEFIKGDLKNIESIKPAFKNKIDAVIHFASYSQVAQGEEYPEKYYENNVLGSINLFDTMIENNVSKIVFSSSAAIYGNTDVIPIEENNIKNPTSIYGQNKLKIEDILSTYKLKSVKLRYFNVCGASDDGEFGEWHNPETHLIPNVLNNNLKLYGNDYNTKDGTCIRDYIDVEDITNAHILACEYLDKDNDSTEINLGTQKGYSVFEIINLCEKITNKKITYEIYPKRKGDCPILVASNKKAKEILNWEPLRSLEDSIKSACKFQNNLRNLTGK